VNKAKSEETIIYKQFKFIIMKKFILTIAAAVLVIGSTFAITGGEPTKANKVLQNKISEMIPYPDFAFEENIEVSVFAIVSLNENGDITVERISSTNQDMKNYVVTELSKIQLADESIEAGKQYKLRVDFRAL